MRPSLPPPGSAAARAYDYAKWAILNAVYSAGDVITEGGLAAELGVSRTPVREALLRLEVEGLVQLRPKKGAVVATFTLEDVDDVLEARTLVETGTAHKSFERRAELLPAVVEVHQEMCRRRHERDTAGFTDADRRFHELIVDAAGNSVISGVYRMLRERQTLFSSAMVRGRTDRMDGAIAEHERILAVLRGDDAEAFARVVREHLAWSSALARETE
ncbi:GntR family transcriptional regulator [Nocardioides iriomotensis]|uniref:GntR family transcriptional regulator n=1 Tax=Nocardioides iriomotensis TaxID=715784 RepID=A0A4Q5IX24_9ACTN|nr:GntR family transcriptional regulator [Nocardioides iriomotensis]RYU10513.1 GntR family transcriptional regulator [Nocardioides iriomotensis]